MAWAWLHHCDALPTRYIFSKLHVPGVQSIPAWAGHQNSVKENLRREFSTVQPAKPAQNKRTKETHKVNIQGFFQVRFCSSSGCLLNPQNIFKTKTSKHKVSSCCQQIAEMQLANLDLTFAEMMVRYIMSQIIPCFCLLPRCNFLGGRSSK